MKKTCLILGSNSDVGQACAYRFAREGFDLLLAARRQDDYQQRLAADLSIRHQIGAKTLYFDGVKYEEHRAFYENLPAVPDVVISVFGYLGDQQSGQNNFEETHLIIDANFTGHVSILNLAANNMEQRKSGAIIGVSSVAGERGRKSNYLYGAAKAGFSAYMSGLRNRLAHSGVQAITVKPGFIRTKMIGNLPTPKPLTAQPEQVAEAIWKAYRGKKNTIYVLPVWRLIMFIIRNIPEFIFKKLSL